MRATVQGAALIVMMGMTAGCGTVGGLELIDDPQFANRQVCLDNGFIDEKSNLTTKLLTAGLDDATAVNKFLDCLVADLKTGEFEALSAADQKIRNELFLYRGHIVVTLLSRYGAFNVTGKVGSAFNINFSTDEHSQGDAASILTRIEAAEKGLRSASSIAGLAGGGSLKATKTPTVHRLHRVADVIQVAVAVEKPTIRRAKNFVERVIAAVGGSPTSGLAALNDALNGLKKLTVLKFFTRAYLADAKKDLDTMMKNNMLPGKTDWDLWSEDLKEACDRLADFSNNINHCTP